MNKITIYGRLTSDPELRQTQNGKSTCSFTVAVDNGKDKDGNDRPADFIPCRAWEAKANFVGRYFTKGKPILLTGAFKTDKYQDKKHEDVTHYSSYVLVNEVEFVGSKNDGGQTAPAQTQAAPAEKPNNQFEEILADDDAPF